LAGPDPVPITADQAFDAVMKGIDPIDGVDYGIGKVVIVDLRTPAEFQFQGTAGKVESILLAGAADPVVPDLGKARNTTDGKSLEYTIGGKRKRTRIDRIANVVTAPIAVNIPCATWNPDTKQMDPTPDRLIRGIEE